LAIADDGGSTPSGEIKYPVVIRTVVITPAMMGKIESLRNNVKRIRGSYNIASLTPRAVKASTTNAADINTMPRAIMTRDFDFSDNILVSRIGPLN
jgi:hypothetical protein